ncbi:hypothetical protein [Nocardia lijiangensis]|uniref:hypothetical protein n=1 Tax=Nocardia lijiangensis TaxID=299618 RepID=UPI003D764BFD
MDPAPARRSVTHPIPAALGTRMGPIHVIESFVPAMVRAGRGGAYEFVIRLASARFSMPPVSSGS